jgi:adenylate kinase family enzyme
MNKIYFITGASGAGKTTTAKNLENSKLLDASFYYFDRSHKIPTREEMEKEFGSQENWQLKTTSTWVNEIKNEILSEKSAILDRQTRLSYIKKVCEEDKIDNYEIILFDCEDSVREERLIKRGHPELANSDMRNWAKSLRNEALEYGAKIIDTTNVTPEESMQKLLNILNEKER